MEYRVLPHGGEKVSAIGTQPEEFAAMITDRLSLSCGITELTDRPHGYAVGPVLLYWHIRNAFSASWKVSICSLSL